MPGVKGVMERADKTGDYSRGCKEGQKKLVEGNAQFFKHSQCAERALHLKEILGPAKQCNGSQCHEHKADVALPAVEDGL